jgi:hypothetical protein
LFQYQREQDEEGYILANQKDYEIAKGAFSKITSNSAMIPLSKGHVDILKIFEELESGWYSVNDLADKFPYSDRWLRKKLDELFDLKFLDKDKETREGIKQQIMVYRNKEENKIEIPTWDKINSIDSKHSIDSKVGTIESIESFELKSSEQAKPKLFPALRENILRMIGNAKGPFRCMPL